MVSNEEFYLDNFRECHYNNLNLYIDAKMVLVAIHFHVERGSHRLKASLCSNDV